MNSSSLRISLFLLISGVTVAPAHSLPTGGNVVSGEATLEKVNPNQLNINQTSDRAILHWETFNITPQGEVNFYQPSATSATLNRVTGSTPSDIAGRITAQGKVLLVNPNGIMFTPTAQVDVGSLVVSTLDIEDRNFLEGTYRFDAPVEEVPAGIENQGNITVSEGGMAAFIAPHIVNRGVIAARLGTVAMASGQGVTLDLVGNGFLQIQVDPLLAQELTDIYGNPLSALISQSGEILADGGQVILSAAMVEQLTNKILGMDGVIEANRVENQDGRIVLRGDGPGEVNIAGQIKAEGGRLEVSARELTLDSEIGQPKGSGNGAKAMEVALQLGSEDEQGSLNIGEQGFLRVKELEIGSPYQGELGEASVMVDNSRADGLHGQTLSLNTRLDFENFGFNPSNLVNVNAGGSIQNGVNAVADGGFVAIGAGRFTEGNTISVDRSMTIAGAGDGNDPSNNTIISGENSYAVFDVPSGNIRFDGLRIIEGKAQSGGGMRIQDEAVVNITNTVFSNNTAQFGGAIDNAGTLTLNRTLLSGNTASNSGAAISNSGTLTILTSRISENTAILGGGGIFNVGGTMTITNTRISDNVVSGEIVNGSMLLSLEEFADRVSLEQGQPLTIEGLLGEIEGLLNIFSVDQLINGISIDELLDALSINDLLLDSFSLRSQADRISLDPANNSISLLYVNAKLGDGGGIDNRGGTLTLSQSTLSGNTALNSGGGLANAPNPNDSFTTTIKNSTISGNTAQFGGGIANARKMNIVNSTIANNRSIEAAGGIANDGQDGVPDITLTNVLVTGNFSDQSASEIYNLNILRFEGGNLIGASGNDGLNQGSPIVVRQGTFTGNFITPNVPSNQIITGLGGFGGITQVHNLVPGSPAINGGVNAGISTDQRGAPRPVGGAFDIGAVEFGSTAPPIPQPPAAPTPPPPPPVTPPTTDGGTPQAPGSFSQLPDSAFSDLYRQRQPNQGQRDFAYWTRAIYTRNWRAWQGMGMPGRNDSRYQLVTDRYGSFNVGVAPHDFRDGGKVNLLDRPIEPRRQTTFYTHGWNSDHQGSHSNLFATDLGLASVRGGAVDQRIMVDWGQGAKTSPAGRSRALRAITSPLPLSLREELRELQSAARRIPTVAEALALRILESGLKPEEVDLVGHSLGSYVSVEAARILYQRYDFAVNSVTLLDPANVELIGYEPPSLSLLSEKNTSTLAIYDLAYGGGNPANNGEYARRANRSIGLSGGRNPVAGHDAPIELYGSLLKDHTAQTIDDLRQGTRPFDQIFPDASFIPGSSTREHVIIRY